MAYINVKCARRSFASPARKIFTIVRAGKTGGCFLVRSMAVWFDGIKIGSVERHFTMLKLVCPSGMGWERGYYKTIKVLKRLHLTSHDPYQSM